MIRKTLFLWIFPLLAFQSPLSEQFKKTGYVEICNEEQGRATFDSLYASFDLFIDFVQANPVWKQKLYIAKERFIRSKERNYYSTDFFGLYDESERIGRSQISFYYSTHFHEFICAQYPDFNQIPEIMGFFGACLEVQKPCRDLFGQATAGLGLETIFCPSTLLKVMKYLPSYAASRPHYDGSVFSLFLNSTDNRSLLLSPYKSSFAVDDFSSPIREFDQNSMLLIPGALLTEFSIYPTPHIVIQSGKIRYSTIAFAMRHDYIPQKTKYSPLPCFNN